MERNYVGQGLHSGNSQNNMISSGRRAGTVRPPSGEDSTSSGCGSRASDAGGQHVPRFGRRASPSSTPTAGGMDMDPPKYSPSTRPAGAAIPRGPAAGPGGSNSAGPAAGAGVAGGSGGGMSSKLAGLQRLKEASTARLVSRIPSAGGRPSGDTGGYVPSVMTNPQPARALAVRANSGGRNTGAGSAAGGGTGYGSSAGPSTSAARSASTGPAVGAPVRPPSGRSTGTAAAPSSGYGSSNAKPASSYGASSSSSAAAGGGYGRGAVRSGSGSGAAEYGGGSGRQPAAAPAAAARRAAPAPAPAHAAPPPPQPKPKPAGGAPRSLQPPVGHNHYRDDNDEDAGYDRGGGFGGGFGGGGGGFGGGGAGFGTGSIPPGAEDGGPTGPMVECPTCGRSFNEQAYSKHAKICEKVFATKRKPVNMAAKRLEGSEAVKFFDVRKGVPKAEAKAAAAPAAAGPGRGGAGRGAAAAFDDRPLPGSKMPKWKSQSEQLRAAMAANRKIADAKAKGMDIRDLKFEATPAAQDDRVQCPHCGRKFAELTAERHIPKCKDIMAKPKSLAAGSGRGAHMRR